MRIDHAPRTLAILVLAGSTGLLSPTAAAAQKGAAGIVDRATDAIAPLRDSLALHSAGYFAIGFNGAVKDLSPFQGQHWIQAARFMTNAPVEISKPNFMMYLPVGDSLIPIGVAYTQRAVANSAMPTDLDGTTAEWHTHIFCRNAPGEGNVLADGPEDCKERGGTPAPNEIVMVHTWTVPNPDGPFAHDNPALPFIATGLKPPTHAMKDDRLFGVALGESYGAMLVEAHQIDISLKRANKREQLDKLEKHRAAIRALVPQLRGAERAGQTAKFDAAKKKLLDEWTALAADYRSAAPTPEMRDRFDLELNQALGTMSHHHM